MKRIRKGGVVLRIFLWVFVLASQLCFANGAYAGPGLVVMQTDFGLKDGAVSEMKGVMYALHKGIIVSDLTHEIPPYNIWEASYRLYQTAPYWPAGTVFISVVDPGVGTSRKSVVALSKTGHYFVTPDNGTLTLVEDQLGLSEVRTIDEKTNRLPGSHSSHTFHGRDVFAYTAARLAMGFITFEQVGPKSGPTIVKLPYAKAEIREGNKVIRGTLVILDPEYGNVWTNIDQGMVDRLKMSWGATYKVRIFNSAKNTKIYEGVMPYQKTFGDVPKGTPLLYANSLLNLSIGINQGNFSREMHVDSGPEWQVEIEKN